MTTEQTNIEERQHDSEKQMLLGSALPKGSRLGKYTVVKPLGAGGFGITYLVVRKDGNIDQRYVIKEFFMKGCDRDRKGTVSCASTLKKDFKYGRDDFKKEAAMLQKLQTSIPNIVRVNEHFDANGTSYYVMQYLDGGDLHKRTPKGGMSESVALSIIIPIANAVEKLHKQGMLHLDIKPDNIVMQRDPATGSDVPVLIDFGVAKHFDKSGRPTTQAVAKGYSAGYAPLEQRDRSRELTFSPTLDVYALGATLFFLLTSEQPTDAFQIVDNHSLLQQMLAKIPAGVSQRTRNAIAKAMKLLAKERTQTAADFVASLGEPYTLPIGYVLHSPKQLYMITEVCREADSYITYKAIPASHTHHPHALSSGRQTVPIAQYYIYEDFFKPLDKREESGWVNHDPRTRPILAWFTSSFRKKFEKCDVHGNLQAEQFYTNNTNYGALLIAHHSLVQKTMGLLTSNKKMLLLLFAAIIFIVITVIASAQCSGYYDGADGWNYDSTEADTVVVDTTTGQQEFDAEYNKTKQAANTEEIVSPQVEQKEIKDVAPSPVESPSNPNEGKPAKSGSTSQSEKSSKPDAAPATIKQNNSNIDDKNKSRGDEYYSKWIESGKTDNDAKYRATYYYQNVSKGSAAVSTRLQELQK